LITLQSKVRRHLCNIQLYWPRISSEAQESLEATYSTRTRSMSTPPPLVATYHPTIEPMTPINRKTSGYLLRLPLYWPNISSEAQNSLATTYSKLNHITPIDPLLQHLFSR